jgi:predicted ATPase
MWLKANGIKDVILRDALDLTKIEYDLCISNYAFTEFDKETQDRYVNTIFKHSKHGFIICNFFNSIDDGIPIMLKLLRMNHDYLIIHEEPETDRRNFIYTW